MQSAAQVNMKNIKIIPEGIYRVLADKVELITTSRGICRFARVSIFLLTIGILMTVKNDYS